MQTPNYLVMGDCDTCTVYLTIVCKGLQEAVWGSDKVTAFLIRHPPIQKPFLP